MKFIMRPAGYTLLNHKGNDALEELQIPSINELETSMKLENNRTWKQVVRQGRGSGRPPYVNGDNVHK
jgi:hypothetical protein